MTNRARDVQLLQILKSNLIEIGVDMEIRSMDPAAERPFVMAKKFEQMLYMLLTKKRR